MVNRQGEFDENSTSAEIEEAIRLEQENIDRKLEQYDGELDSGTPYEDLKSLRYEIDAHRLEVQRGTEILDARESNLRGSTPNIGTSATSDSDGSNPFMSTTDPETQVTSSVDAETQTTSTVDPEQSTSAESSEFQAPNIPNKFDRDVKKYAIEHFAGLNREEYDQVMSTLGHDQEGYKHKSKEQQDRLDASNAGTAVLSQEELRAAIEARDKYKKDVEFLDKVFEYVKTHERQLGIESSGIAGDFHRGFKELGSSARSAKSGWKRMPKWARRTVIVATAAVGLGGIGLAFGSDDRSKRDQIPSSPDESGQVAGVPGSEGGQQSTPPTLGEAPDAGQSGTPEVPPETVPIPRDYTVDPLSPGESIPEEIESIAYCGPDGEVVEIQTTRPNGITGIYSGDQCNYPGAGNQVLDDENLVVGIEKGQEPGLGR